MKNQHTRALAALALSLVAAGCGNRHDAEQAVRQSLKDPDSAKFGEFYFSEKTKCACLMVNARNEMGGYTGERAFELKNDNGWTVVAEQPQDGIFDCRGSFADVVEP